MQIRSLELRARVIVEGFFHGLHKSPHHGFSAEFSEYRQYALGDDLRYLDWMVYARTDRDYVKKFEDETNLRGYLVVDQSRSMEFRSGAVSKAEYAVTLAAALAWLLHLQGDAVGLLSFDEAPRSYLPARHHSAHLRKLMHALEAPAGGHSTNLAPPLTKMAELARRRGMIVFISDLLADLNELERHLHRLRSAGHEAVLFQILDPAELEFNFSDVAVFEDQESGHQFYVDPQKNRPRYRERLRRHNDRIRETCLGLEVDYHSLSTAEPLNLALFEFLRRRNKGRVLRQRNVGAKSRSQ